MKLPTLEENVARVRARARAIREERGLSDPRDYVDHRGWHHRVLPVVAEVGSPPRFDPGVPFVCYHDFFREAEAIKALDMVGVRLAGPTPADTVAGVVAWWRADPAHRRVEIMLNGHVVHARATRLDPIAVRSIEFQVPSPAERVPATLDALFATEAR